jgi:hypothetical protein
MGVPTRRRHLLAIDRAVRVQAVTDRAAIPDDDVSVDELYEASRGHLRDIRGQAEDTFALCIHR